MAAGLPEESVKALEEKGDVEGLIAVLRDTLPDRGVGGPEGERHVEFPGDYRHSEKDRAEAALALGRLGGHRAMEALIAAVAARDETVAPAEEALLMFPVSEIAPILVGILHGQTADSIEALIPAWRPLHSGWHRLLRLNAVAKAAHDELWSLLDRRAAACSSRLLEDLLVLPDLALTTLTWHGDARYPHLHDEVQQVRTTIDCSKIRRLAARCLRQRPTDAAQAVESLIALLSGPYTSPQRSFAADALGALGDARAAEPLAREAQNPQNRGGDLAERAHQALLELARTTTDADSLTDAYLRCLAEWPGSVPDDAFRRLGTTGWRGAEPGSAKARRALAALEAERRARQEEAEAALREVPSEEQLGEAVKKLEASQDTVLERTARGGRADIETIIESLLEDITKAAGLADFGRSPLVTECREAARKAAGRYATDHRDSLKGEVDPRPFADKLVRPAVAAYLRVLKQNREGES